MANDYALTTLDNPYNPITQFDEWLVFDISMGYNTCGLLARIAKTSNELSDVDNELAIDQAMDEIVKQNVFGNLIKVDKDFVPRNIEKE